MNIVFVYDIIYCSIRLIKSPNLVKIGCKIYALQCLISYYHISLFT